MTTSAQPSAIPAGFFPIPIPDQFVELVGPYLCKPEADGLRLGLVLEPRHGNVMGVAHGGNLVTLADMVMGVGSGYATGIFWPHPTITLNCDFVRGARIGMWVEGKARITRRTQNFCFCSCDITADGDIVLAASGVFKVPDLERIPEAQKRQSQEYVAKLKSRV